ncbi:MAG: HsdR family type I site-specific deoxyribonuclease [Planctomycetota bacterium]
MFGACPVAVPPENEQKQIEAILGAVDTQEEVAARHLQQLLVVKRGLMQDLLTGHRRVPLSAEEIAAAEAEAADAAARQKPTPPPEAARAEEEGQGVSVRPDEDSLAEQPALELLRALGYTYVPGAELTAPCAERDTFRQVVLKGRLRAAIKRLNPWINEANLNRAVQRITQIETTSLMEANEKVHHDLTRCFSVDQEVGATKKQTVRLIDFDNPENNEFLVVNQFVVKGAEEKRPDVVLFVNGLPLAVIECKSPKLTHPRAEAIKQLHVYQEEIPRLFWFNYVCVAAAGSAGAWYGAIQSPDEFFFAWKDPWPLKKDDLRQLVDRAPTPQDRLLASLFQKARFLDLLRDFVVYEREGNATIKKLPRYQQYNAVSKTLERIRSGETPKDKSGVVWHTQGSGKSLTMVWLALKLRRDPLHENPTIVLVTDRTDLDRQIHGVFKNCGFRVHRSDSVRDLRKQLSGPGGLTVTTTVHKFQEDKAAEDPVEAIPVLSTATNVFALVDEAHRSQYRGLAANMRTALPNAIFLGFTGTPIDKTDRQTHKTFGPYVDTYTIQQAVDDGATVPIFYEGRLPELQIEGGDDLDTLFDRFFSDKSPEERNEIKKRYVKEEAIAGAPDRVKKIAFDLLKHYEQHIAPGGFKAQVVAVNRETAVLYKERIDALKGPECAVVVSVDHNDTDPRLKACKRSKEEQAALIERFKQKDDPLRILVVCDMLLTGFDAPIEQVMYLDKGLKEHNLLQAIARVNRRCGADKSYGLIVDYWGVSSFLEQALAIFNKAEVQGALTPTKDELPQLQAHHAKALSYFAGIEHHHGRFQTEKQAADVFERCMEVLEPEDKRAEFLAAFKYFSRSMDRVLPDPVANPYRADLHFLGTVVAAARTRFRDTQLNLEGCGEKVRQLIAEHVRTLKIELLVEPISILSGEFDAHVQKLASPRAKASEMEHAIRHEIRVNVDEDPTFFDSLRSRLEEIIEARKESRLNDKEAFDRLRALQDELRGRAELAQAHEMTEQELAFYGLLTGTTPTHDLSKRHRQLARDLVETLEELAVIDWENKASVQKDMKRSTKRLLRAFGYEEGELAGLVNRLIDLAKYKLRTRA